MLTLLESNKNLIKDFKKYRDVFYRFNKIIKNEKGTYDFNDIESLMDNVRNLKGKQGFKIVFNHTKNIMLEKLREIHFDMIRSLNIQNGNDPVIFILKEKLTF